MDKCCVEETIMTISILNVRLATVWRCLVDRENRGGYCQEKYDDTYWELTDAALKQLIGNVRNFVKRLGLEGPGRRWAGQWAKQSGRDEDVKYGDQWIDAAVCEKYFYTSRWVGPSNGCDERAWILNEC